MLKKYCGYVVTCSPIYVVNGQETYIVHLRRLREGCRIFDRIAVKIPEYKVVGLYGFSNSEVGSVVDYIRKNKDVIYDIAFQDPNYTPFHVKCP